jgi:hypothetical protein
LALQNGGASGNFGVFTLRGRLGGPDALKELTGAQSDTLVFTPYEAQGSMATVGLLEARLEEGAGGPGAAKK